MSTMEDSLREQGLVPCQYEPGYQFQFVSVPSSSIAEPPLLVEHGKARQGQNRSESAFEKVNFDEVETVFIESEGSDEEGITRNVIIKSVERQGQTRLIIESKSLATSNEVLSATSSASQTPITVNTNSMASLPKSSVINRQSSGQDNALVNTLSAQIPETTYNAEENQESTSGKQSSNKQAIYYQAPVSDGSRLRLLLNKGELNRPAPMSVNKVEKLQVAGEHQLKNVTHVRNSGAFTIQHNEVQKGGHQVISSGPVILNTPGFVSINSAARHFILPKDSLPNGNMNYQIASNQNHMSFKLSSPKPNILRPVPKPLLKVIKIGTSGSSANVYQLPNSNIQEANTNSLRVKSLDSLREDPDANIYSHFLEEEKESNMKDVEMVDYPDFVQVYRPKTEKKELDSQSVKTQVHAFPNNPSYKVHSFPPSKIQGFCDNSIQLQPFSLDFQNLLQQNLMQLHSVTPKTAQSSGNTKLVAHSGKHNDQIDKNHRSYSRVAGAQSNIKNSQTRNWTYVEVYPEAKKTNKEPNVTTNDESFIKYGLEYFCFGSHDWTRSLYKYSSSGKFGFNKKDRCTKKCLLTLNSNINYLEKRLRQEYQELEIIQKLNVRNYSKQSAMTTFLSDDFMETDYLSDWSEHGSEESETESTLEDDFFIPTTDSVENADDFDSDLLLTKRVVILKNGTESTTNKKKKNKRRFQFAPPKGFGKKKYVDPKPKERPLDYRVYMKMSAMKKLHNIRRSYVEIESNPLVNKAVALYRRNKKSFLTLSSQTLSHFQEEKMKDLHETEIKQKHMFMNWFNNRIITNQDTFKKKISPGKPMLIITKANINEVRHYKEFNIVFPAVKVLPEDLPRNKEFIRLVGMGHVKIVAARVLSEYFKEI